MKFFDVELQECELTKAERQRLWDADILGAAFEDDDGEVFLVRSYALPSFPNCKFVVNTILPMADNWLILGPNHICELENCKLADGSYGRMFGITLNDETIKAHAALTVDAARPFGYEICGDATKEEVKLAFSYDDDPLTVKRQGDGWRARCYHVTRTGHVVRNEVDILPDGSLDLGSVLTDVSARVLPGDDRSPL